MDWLAHDAQVCSVARTQAILGDRWTVLILRELFHGVHRFDELADHLGISRSVLTQRLAQLVDHGVLERRAYRQVGERRRHEYRLTAKGRDLRAVLVAMRDFGDHHLAGDPGVPVELHHAGCGQPVHARLVCDAGHDVTAGRDLAVQPGPAAVRRPVG